MTDSEIDVTTSGDSSDDDEMEVELPKVPSALDSPVASRDTVDVEAGQATGATSPKVTSAKATSPVQTAK